MYCHKVGTCLPWNSWAYVLLPFPHSKITYTMVQVNFRPTLFKLVLKLYLSCLNMADERQILGLSYASNCNFRLPKCQANFDYCRHFLLMLNFCVFNVLQGIWNQFRYDVTVSRLFQGHGKVKGQMSALANVCNENCNFNCGFSLKSWLKLCPVYSKDDIL